MFRRRVALLLLVLLLSVMLSLALGAQPKSHVSSPSEGVDQPTQQQEQDETEEPTPATTKRAGLLRRVTSNHSLPGASAIDWQSSLYAVWALTVFWQSTALAVHYFSGAPADQPQQQQQAAQGGAGLVPQWVPALRPQHWPDVVPYLPPPLGNLLQHVQQHGRTLVTYSVVAGALAAMGVGGWALYLEEQRIALQPGCWAHMVAAARNASNDGEYAMRSWRTMPEQAKAFWRARSTGPCDTRRFAVQLHSAWLARPVYALAKVLFDGTVFDDGWAVKDRAMTAAVEWVVKQWDRLDAAVAEWRAPNAIDLLLLIVLLAAALVWYYWGALQEALERRMLRVGVAGVGVLQPTEELGMVGGPYLPSEEARDERSKEAVAAAFVKKQQFVHRRMAVLAEACAARHAQRAVATYYTCRRLLKAIDRLRLEEGEPLNEAQLQWIDALWGWFDFLVAGLRDWVDHGRVPQSAVACIKGEDAQADTHTRRTSEAVVALQALISPLRRRYFAECGSQRRCALSFALTHMLRQSLPAPEPRPVRFIHRIKFLPIQQEYEDDAPRDRHTESPRAVLLRARVLAAGGGLASSPRLSLLTPFLAAADRQAVAAAVLGPVRYCEQRPLRIDHGGLVPAVDLAELDRVLEALEAEGAEGLWAALADYRAAREEAVGVEMEPCGDRAPSLRDSSSGVEPGGGKHAGMSLTFKATHALEVIVELRGRPPPMAARGRWWEFKAERESKKAAARAVALAAAAAAGTAVEAGPPSPPSSPAPVAPATPEAPAEPGLASSLPPRSLFPSSPSSITPTDLDLASLLTDAGEEKGEEEPRPSSPVSSVSSSSSSDRRVTWADPLVESEVTPTDLLVAGSGSSSSGEAGQQRRSLRGRVARAAGLVAAVAVVLFLAWRWDVRRLRSTDTPFFREPLVDDAQRGSLPQESSEPLTYAEWQRLARGRWKDLGHPRVGEKGRTVAEMIKGTASERDRLLFEAVAAWDPTWRPGRHFHSWPEFLQFHDQWVKAAAVGGEDGGGAGKWEDVYE